MPHAVDHGDPDPGFGGFRQTFVVLAQVPRLKGHRSPPGEGARHHPAPGLDLEARYLGQPGHDVQDPVGGLSGQPSAQLGALAATIGPDDLQAREPVPRRARTRRAPSRSWRSAVGTTTARSSPKVSTTMGHLRPLTCWPASSPRSPATSVVWTDGRSRMAALGVASLPARGRTRGRRASWMPSQSPSRRHRRKSP